MAETSVHREQTETGEAIVLRNSHLDLRLESGAQLVLCDPMDERTRIAGGPLIELAPARGARRPRTVGVGLGRAMASEPQPFEDNLGTGLLLRRSFPIAVQPLNSEWTIRLYDEHPFVRIDLALHNGGTEPMTIRRVFPFVTGSWWGNGALRLGQRQADFACYKTGWQSWSYAGGIPERSADVRPRRRALAVWHSPGGRNPRQPVSGTADIVSDGVLLFGHPSEPHALLAGFLAQDQWMGQIYARRGLAALAACNLTDDYLLEPGEQLTAAPLLLAVGPQHTLLTAYAEALAREQRAKPASSAPTGWCSWYSYFSDVSEQAVLENVSALRTLRRSIPLEVVQIDDGYQAAVGDWLDSNAKFPHGMAHLAARIRDAGYRPGLWLAPFTVAANSRLAQEHPDWLVHDAKGRPAHGGRNWNTALYGLDTSHPGARSWLADTCTTIVREWGFDYLKLDFLASAAIPGRRYDPTTTRARALRDGLTLIREAVGDDVWLLGCGCPWLSAVGLVDALRIGPDSAPRWQPRFKGFPVPLSDGHTMPSLHGAVRNTLERAWMHPALWVNDPDCMILRETRSELTLDEVRAFATAVGLTGGMVLLSDPTPRLTVERLDVLAKLLPPLRERAQPTSYFTWGIPERVAVQIQRPWGQWLLVGLFNEAAGERELEVTWGELGLSPGVYHACEFWTGAYLGRHANAVTVRVPGHGAAALALHADRSEPQLLSTSFHIGQGAVEIPEWRYDPERNVIDWQVRLGRSASGTVTLWLPAGLSPRRVSSTSGRASWQRAASREVIVTAEINDEAHFTLELESDA